MILVVGATGQLGTAVIRKLTALGKKVRAFVRPASSHGHLKDQDVELAFGDLCDADSVAAGCERVDTIIATANTVLPSGRYSFESVEGSGYQNLIDAAKRGGVQQFVFMSVPVTPLDDKVPTFHFKRVNEQRLQQSGVPYTIVRGSLFSDDWLALIGSSIPLRGTDVHTLRRSFWFSSMFLKGVGTLIEDRGVALVPGNGKTRHAFVTLDDVATFIVRSVGHPQAQNALLEVGGPQILSWDEAVGIFSKVLGRPVRALHAPAAVFRLQQQMLTPFSPAAANLMGMNWIAGTCDTAYDMTQLAPAFGVSLTSVEEFLRQRVHLPVS